MASTTPYITDEEIYEMAKPLTQKAAIRRWFERQGFVFKRKPNGLPLISRAHFDAHLSGNAAPPPAANDSQASSAEPDVQALLKKIGKGVPYGDGEKTKKQPARPA